MGWLDTYAYLVAGGVSLGYGGSTLFGLVHSAGVTVPLAVSGIVGAFVGVIGVVLGLKGAVSVLTAVGEYIPHTKPKAKT